EEVEAKAAARAAGAVAPPEAPGAVLPFNPELGAALRAELLGHLFGTEELPETPPVAGKDIWEDWE
ncbi:MAG TPA: hypothetical protein VIL46_17940, partial [Gemmataceae bacterium]